MTDMKRSDEFRGEMRLPHRVPKSFWCYRPELPLQISSYLIPHDDGLVIEPGTAACSAVNLSQRHSGGLLR